MASGQLSKANEPCVTDADCLAQWEFCAERKVVLVASSRESSSPEDTADISSS